MTTEDYKDFKSKVDKTINWMKIIEYGTATIGLVIVFGFYWKQTKPTFVKIIWAFIALGILNGVTQLSL